MIQPHQLTKQWESLFRSASFLEFSGELIRPVVKIFGVIFSRDCGELKTQLRYSVFGIMQSSLRVTNNLGERPRVAAIVAQPSGIFRDNRPERIFVVQ